MATNLNELWAYGPEVGMNAFMGTGSWLGSNERSDYIPELGIRASSLTGGPPASAQRNSGVGVGAGVGGGTAGSIGDIGAGNAASIEALTRMVNEINQSAQQSANAGRIPGGAGLEQQSSANIGSALRGEVDPSTRYLLGQSAAERGVASGSPMGANSNADYLRALGLTSFDRMNTGQGWLSAATARNPAAPIYDAGNQVTTAAQQLQAQLTREQMANAYRIAQLNARNSRGGGGGGAPSQPSIRTSAGNWQPIFGADTPAQSPTNLGTSTTTSSWPVQPSPATSLYDMGGNYFRDTLYGTPAPVVQSPGSLQDFNPQDYFDYSNPNPAPPTSLTDPNWDSYFGG